MSLTKQELQQLNNTNFPNNTTGYITPALLRDFNSQSVDSFTLQSQFDVNSASVDSRLDSLESFSSSLVTNFATVAQLNASSSTLQSNINGKASTGSVNTLSQSVYVGFSDQATINTNVSNTFTANETKFNAYTQSNNLAVAGKASLSQDNYFVGNQYVTGKITATGTVTGSNITSYALDTASFNSFTSSQNFTNSTLVTTSSFNTFSGSQYKTDSSSFDSRIDNLESWSSSLDVTYATDAQLNASSSTLQSNINTLSSSTFQTDATQSNNINSNSSSIGLLQTFSGSQYKADSASFDSRINSVTASGGNISVQDEGSILGNATSFNFIGSGVSATFSAGTASITIPGGGGSIYTGSFATTGSNSFRGTQTLLQTGSWGGVLLNVQSGSIKFNGQVADTGWEGTGSIFLSPVNLPHGSTKVVFQTEYQSGSTNPNGWDYLLGLGRQGDTFAKTVDIGTDVTFDVSRANLVGFPFVTTSSFDVFSGSQYKTDSSSFDSRINNIGAVTASSIITASVSQSTITFTKGDNSTFSIVVADVSGSTIDTGSLVTTASFNAFTSSQIVSNSYFATTGSNFFVGSQWISDTTDTTSYNSLSEWSGSLIISTKGYSTSSFAHFTSSLANPAAVRFVNLLFKGDGVEAQSIISGSNNILANPVAPTATFYRQVGNGNLALTGLLPQVSASMLFPITMNGNSIGAIANGITMRGPVSSSAWNISANNILGGLTLGSSTANHVERIVNGLTITGNSIAGAPLVIANQSTLGGVNVSSITNNNINGSPALILSSSNMAFGGNTINSSPTITNAYYSSSLGLGIVSINNNTIGGGAHTLIISGALPTGATSNPVFSNNIINGQSNTLYSNVAAATVSSSVAQATANSTHIFGANLIVSASAGVAQFNTIGSAFIGRYNDISGNKAKTGETIFAIGTGNTTNRKTGFLIDSGSNTFVEGTLNVSGSTSMTGSLSIQSGSGDLFMYGHKMFNVGAFYSTITQSGSAAVSQSMQFDTTDISQGVSLNGGGTQMIVANAGTYNIQFSAQLLADTGADDVYIWLKKNGTNLSNTAGRVTLSNNDELMAAWNYVVEAVANDYFELCWQSTSGDAVLLYNSSTGNIPGITSVIATVTQVR